MFKEENVPQKVEDFKQRFNAIIEVKPCDETPFKRGGKTEAYIYSGGRATTVYKDSVLHFEVGEFELVSEIVKKG